MHFPVFVGSKTDVAVITAVSPFASAVTIFTTPALFTVTLSESEVQSTCSGANPRVATTTVKPTVEPAAGFAIVDGVTVTEVTAGATGVKTAALLKGQTLKVYQAWRK